MQQQNQFDFRNQSLEVNKCPEDGEGLLELGFLDDKLTKIDGVKPPAPKTFQVPGTRGKKRKQPDANTEHTSAYALFAKDLLKADSGLANNPQAYQIISATWEKCSPSERTVWLRQASNAKQRGSFDLVQDSDNDDTEPEGTKKKPRKKRKKKDPDAPKNAKTAYACYQARNRALVAAQDSPDHKGPLKPREILKKLAAMWKALPEAEKQEYIEESNKDKERYKREMAVYEEKKRKEAEKAAAQRASAAQRARQVTQKIVPHPHPTSYVYPNPMAAGLALPAHLGYGHIPKPEVKVLKVKEKGGKLFDRLILHPPFTFDRMVEKIHDKLQITKPVKTVLLLPDMRIRDDEDVTYLDKLGELEIVFGTTRTKKSEKTTKAAKTTKKKPPITFKMVDAVKKEDKPKQTRMYKQVRPPNSTNMMVTRPKNDLPTNFTELKTKRHSPGGYTMAPNGFSKHSPPQGPPQHYVPPPEAQHAMAKPHAAMVMSQPDERNYGRNDFHPMAGGNDGSYNNSMYPQTFASHPGEGYASNPNFSALATNQPVGRHHNDPLDSNATYPMQREYDFNSLL